MTTDLAQGYVQRPLVVVVDTETTGLGHADWRGPRPDGVVQVGLAWRESPSVVSTWSRFCNPGPELLADGRAAEAMGVNGLTAEQILGFAPAKVVATQLREFLQSLSRAAVVELRAFNVAFDRPFLEAEPWSVHLPWGSCLMLRSADRFGTFNGRIPLWRACAAAGVTVEGHFHSAEVDAKAALLLSEFLDREGSSPLGTGPVAREATRGA